MLLIATFTPFTKSLKKKKKKEIMKKLNNI